MPRYRRTLVGLKVNAIAPFHVCSGYRRTLVGLKGIAAYDFKVCLYRYRRTLVGLKERQSAVTDPELHVTDEPSWG